MSVNEFLIEMAKDLTGAKATTRAYFDKKTEAGDKHALSNSSKEQKRIGELATIVNESKLVRDMPMDAKKRGELLGEWEVARDKIWKLKPVSVRAIVTRVVAAAWTP